MNNNYITIPRAVSAISEIETGFLSALPTVETDEAENRVKLVCAALGAARKGIENLAPSPAIETLKIRLTLGRLRMNYEATTQEARTAYLTALMDVERELFGDPGAAGR